ncbi:hypothetical protein SAMN04487752_1145 [Carnobacterium viridans]|uniref:Uncharacterized protein n=1 Tax=Carnobacterium viridans TaxID=174587 RepID=A0A1H0YTG2_9LACT|nr:hypothetical protein SAMN04487752_0280 [Carnobacterium viridans]SDQ18453.1 hypothetical protein SAMN04487752_1145 [Carnobacterium viridans]
MLFLSDLIHLTQGELLIKYWWLWLVIVIIAIKYELFKDKHDKF